ncbi:hypothetical protein [Streptomyces pharetrae]|uniref:hypothetical protein n=1 Tax=Streptomyces pharetrae TaxID=291370 RepID=UPI0026A7374B
MVKGLDQPYLPGKRVWGKVRSHVTSEAVLAGITGSLTSPQTLLLGRYDTAGHLRLVARTTPLRTADRREIAQRVIPGGPEHPWRGRRFSVGWGTRGELECHSVCLELVVEFIADTSIDGAAIAVWSAICVYGTTSRPTRYHRSTADTL